MLEDGVRANSFWIFVRWFGTVAALFILAVSFNNLTADSNCGEPEEFYFHPYLKIQTSEVAWKLRKSAVIHDQTHTTISFKSYFSTALPADSEMIHFIDDVQVERDTLDRGDDFRFDFNTRPAWKSHTYEAVLRVGNEFCRRKEEFASTHKELKDKKLFLNGE